MAKATGPDREIDVALYSLEIPQMLEMWPHWDEEQRALCVPAFTDSIDAALALVNRLLPNWRVENLCEWDDEQLRARGPWTCDLMPRGKDFSGGTWGKCPHAPTAPLALVSALLAALINAEPQP